MELGRLLRDEGITPAMIRANRELLVNAMKSTLKTGSVPESFVTAPEYNLNSYPLSVTEQRNASCLGSPSAFSSISLLGSAPPRSAGFTDAFLERESNVASSLSQKPNLDNGMRSLLQGMNGEDDSVEESDDEMDDIELEDVDDEDVQPEGDSKDDGSTYYEPFQEQDVKHVLKPLLPTSVREESSRDLEEESAGVRSAIKNWQRPMYIRNKQWGWPSWKDIWLAE